MKLGTCTEWLFFHLWKKNPNSGHSCNGVFLADTVIYRWAQPYFRYFTAQNGQIIRKTKERVFIEQVEQAFLQDNTVAVLMTSQAQSKQQEVINFEYFDKENFGNFLYQREKELNSILQKFIYPKSDHNSIIKVTWSPQFCLINRKTNINNMNDYKKTLYERVSTFDGPEYLSVSDSISSPLLSSDLEQLCVNIVKHVQEVSGGNIQIIRMILYFKVDQDNRIWLMFCTGMKVKDKFSTHPEKLRTDSPLFKIIRRDLEPVITGTENIQKVVKYNSEGQIEELLYQLENVCSNCDLFASELYQLQFQQIIESFERQLVSNEFTRLSEDLQKIKIKNDKKSELLKLNQHIKTRSKQFIHKDYQLSNYFEQQQQNSGTQSQQEILVEKYKLVNNKKTSDQVHAEIQELCRYLDEEQEDFKLNFKTVPALILKVWGKLSEDKYKLLKFNPSWRQLKTQVCLDCYLKYTECCNLTQFERKVKTTAQNLKKKVEDQQANNILLQNTLLEINKNNFTQNFHSSLPPVIEQKSVINGGKVSIVKTANTQQRSTALNTPPQPIQNTLEAMPQFFNKFIKQDIKPKKALTTQKIYQNRQGLQMSLNHSSQSRSSRSTQDQSKISFDYMITTVSQLKKKLQELEVEEQSQKNQEIQKQQVLQDQSEQTSLLQNISNEFTRLSEDLQKIKIKNDKKSELLKLNQHIKTRSKQFIHKDYQLSNYFEQQQQNSGTQSQQEILVEKYKLVNNKKTSDQVHAEIQELCRYLDEEQEDFKLNFKTVPALILKVWGKLSEDKYKLLKFNPSWRQLKTQVCLDCYLKYTECCNLTQFERKVKTTAQNLKKKVEDQQANNILLQNTLLEINKNNFTQNFHSSLPPVIEQKSVINGGKVSIVKTANTQQRSTALNTPPQPIQNTLEAMPQFFNKFIKQDIKPKKALTTQKIYQNRQGLQMSLNHSSQSRSSRSTQDQSKISFDYMITTVSQLKKKLQELEVEEQSQKNQEIQKQQVLQDQSEQTSLLQNSKLFQIKYQPNK
ncbi:unnamed protein product [Paramecium sonneborni]|uniref:Uncharacterized protein n=1 Tax=Paramecium sonneborni TaxID=65129 RepID=A0A8S1K400_9CILI|nr:unnamed protein product [Paramecium sonneborni]